MAIKAIADFVQGDSFKIKIQHNPIIDITGAVFDLYLSKNEDTTPELHVSYTVPISADAVNGITYINITSEQSAAIPAGKYYVMVKRTLAGDTTTIIRTGLYNVGKVECFKNLDITE
jgi:hypothetical protein